MDSQGWVPFDYDIPPHDNKLPSSEVYVWIYDHNYHGVCMGYWTGWWETVWGSDDINVLAWRYIDYPDYPVEVIEHYRERDNVRD